MTEKNRCELCETFWKDEMIVGSSGACIETCGDGKSYGKHMCDDGNTKSGDGCSNKCIVEKDYTCSGGYPYSKDNCSYISTEIIGVDINKYNDVIIKFTRPVYFRNGTLLPSKDLSITYRNHLGGQSILNFEILNYPLPSRYLFLKTNLYENIRGGIFKDTMITV